MGGSPQSKKSGTPQYFQIARDIAKRIAEGTLKVGERISGRSIMASEYGVSPETIRRAFHLLSDSNVIEVRPQSGAYVLSPESARLYLSNSVDMQSSRDMHNHLDELLNEQRRITKQLSEVTANIAKRQALIYSAAEQGFGLGETIIKSGSWIIGKTIGALAFWQATGATIVAIRRADELIISPGPYAELRELDCLVYVLNINSECSVDDFVNREEQ